MQETVCPECGADWSDGQTCTDHFHLMCTWELDHQLYDVHHLMVLCYHLQHPTLYSTEALHGAKVMLAEFVETDISPQAMRQRMAQSVASDKRTYKIKGTFESHGEYEKPATWDSWASDVTKAGIDSYYQSVHHWAESIVKTLRESGNLD